MVRSSNEDSYAANAKKKLFLVADGMGGHAAGEIASQIAASTMEEVVSKSDDIRDPEDLLRAAAREANARIYETQRQKPELAGMGSTLTVLSFRGTRYYVVQVGDSRAYLLRDGVLEQLTRDHSLVWHLFESGLLRKDELSSHPQKNLITRSIGPHPHIEVDVERGEARVTYDPARASVAQLREAIEDAGYVVDDVEQMADATKLIDLAGKLVLPGLIDSHAHFARTGTNPGHEARDIETAFTMMPRCSICRLSCSPFTARLAWARDMVRPEPCIVDPKLSRMAWSVPTSR